jgi:hypothetical protein
MTCEARLMSGIILAAHFPCHCITTTDCPRLTQPPLHGHNLCLCAISAASSCSPCGWGQERVGT